MAEVFRYGEKDQDRVTYSVLVLVTILAIIFVDYFELSFSGWILAHYYKHLIMTMTYEKSVFHVDK